MDKKLCPILSKVVHIDNWQRGRLEEVECRREKCEAWRENPPGYGYCKMMEVKQ